MRNNDFNYKEMDPFGYAGPLGSHARRLNLNPRTDLVLVGVGMRKVPSELG